MSVREKIDQLISDSIDELEAHPHEPSKPESQMASADFTLEIQQLSAQVRELTTQVATLTTIIKGLRQD
jgi:outer membrane murein-binding lipoprotein Lpp